MSPGRLAEQVADVPQLVGVENAPRGKLFGKLDHDDLTADVEKGVVAFVAVEYVGSGDDQVFFGEILDQVTQDAFPAHVERQAQFVVLVEMEGKIHLVVGPVVCDEQVVFPSGVISFRMYFMAYGLLNKYRDFCP